MINIFFHCLKASQLPNCYMHVLVPETNDASDTDIDLLFKKNKLLLYNNCYEIISFIDTKIQYNTKLNSDYENHAKEYILKSHLFCRIFLFQYMNRQYFDVRSGTLISKVVAAIEAKFRTFSKSYEYVSLLKKLKLLSNDNYSPKEYQMRVTHAYCMTFVSYFYKRFMPKANCIAFLYSISNILLMTRYGILYIRHLYKISECSESEQMAHDAFKSHISNFEFEKYVHISSCTLVTDGINDILQETMRGNADANATENKRIIVVDMSILLLSLHVKGLKDMYENKRRFVNRYGCMEDFYKKFIVTQESLNQAGLLSLGDRKNVSIEVYRHLDCLSALYTVAGKKTYNFIECYKLNIFLVELTETWISALQVFVKNIALYEDLNEMKTLENIAINNSGNALKSLTVVSCLFEGCENSYVTDIKTFDIDTIGMNLAISIIISNFIYQETSLKRFAEFVVASICPLNMDTYVCLVTCIAPVIRKILDDRCSNNAEQELVSEYHWDRIVTLTVIEKTFVLRYCISSIAKMTENEKETLNTECQQLSYALYFGNLPERDDQMKIIHCIMDFAPMMKEENYYDLQDDENDGMVELSTSETISDLIRNRFVMYTNLSEADNKNPRVDSENDKYRCQASDSLIYHNDAKEEHTNTNTIINNTDCQNLLFSDILDLAKVYCEFIASDNNCAEVECRCKGEDCLECCNVVDTDNLEPCEHENTENDK